MCVENHDRLWCNCLCLTLNLIAMKTLRNIISLIIAIVIFINVQAIANSYNHNLPKGVVFQIEIGPLSNVLPVEITNKFEFIESEELPDGTFKYYAGMFTSFNEATVMENSLKFWGYEKSNIIAYFNQRSISLTDANTLLDNQNRFDEGFVLGEVVFPNFDELNSTERSYKFYYSVHIDMDSYRNADNLLETTYEMRLKTNKEDKYMYCIGQLSRIEEAREIHKQLKRDGFENAYIVAYFNDQRIPIAAATEFQQEFDEYTAEAISR